MRLVYPEGETASSTYNKIGCCTVQDVRDNLFLVQYSEEVVQALIKQEEELIA